MLVKLKVWFFALTTAPPQPDSFTGSNSDMIQAATQPTAVVLIMGGLLYFITNAVRVRVYLWVQVLPLVSLLEFK